MIQTSFLALLGSFALRVGGREVTGLPRKAQGLIAFLALQPGRRVPREVAADLLWTQSGPEQSRHSLRQMLVILRRTPAGDLIRSNAEALWIEVGMLEVDALALEAALTGSDVVALSQCASRCPGALLEDLSPVSQGFDEWLRSERARLAGVMARTLHLIVAAGLRSGDFDAAVKHASRLAATDPFDEAEQRLLMECLARAGRGGEAWRQYETFARVLREELDVEPDAETSALAERIRGGLWRPSTVELSPPSSPVADIPMQAYRPPDRLPERPLDADARRSRRFRVGLPWVAVLLGIVASSAGVFALRPGKPPALVFAGFRDVSGVPPHDMMAAGLGDLVRLDLVARYHVRLIADPAADATASESVRDRQRRDAGGRYLLAGTTEFMPEMVRVSAHLINVRDTAELWSVQEDVPATELIRVVEDLSARSARALSPDHEVVTASPPSPSPDAPRLVPELLALGYFIDNYSPKLNMATRQIYLAAVDLDPNSADALWHLANSYIRAAQSTWALDPAPLAEADAILDRASRQDPSNVGAQFNRCVLRRFQGRIPEATALCQLVLRNHPHYPGALRELGNDQLRLGDAAQSITSYQASVEAAPQLPFVFESYRGLGVASLALDRREDAISFLRKSVETDISGVDDEKMWLAAALEMDGQHHEAAAMLADFRDHTAKLPADEPFFLILSAPGFAGVRTEVRAALDSAAR